MEANGHGKVMKGVWVSRQGRKSNIFLRPSPEVLEETHTFFINTKFTLAQYTARFNNYSKLTEAEPKFINENHPHTELLNISPPCEDDSMPEEVVVPDPLDISRDDSK